MVWGEIVRSLTEWVLGHRLLVALAWIAVAVAGVVAAPTTVDRLSYAFDLPGQPAYETNVKIAAAFGGGGTTDPLVVVVRGDDAETGAATVADAITQRIPGTRAVTSAAPGAEVLSAGDGTLSTVLLYPPVTPGPEPYAATQPQIEQAIGELSATGIEAELTGFLMLTEGSTGDDRSVLVEALFGASGQSSSSRWCSARCWR